MAQDKLSEISTQNNRFDPAAEGFVMLPQWNGDLDKEASRTNLPWPRKRKPRCNPLILPSEEAVCYCLAVPHGPRRIKMRKSVN